MYTLKIRDTENLEVVSIAIDKDAVTQDEFYQLKAQIELDAYDAEPEEDKSEEELTAAASEELRADSQSQTVFERLHEFVDQHYYVFISPNMPQVLTAIAMIKGYQPDTIKQYLRMGFETLHGITSKFYQTHKPTLKMKKTVHGYLTNVLGVSLYHISMHGHFQVIKTILRKDKFSVDEVQQIISMMKGNHAHVLAQSLAG